MQLLHLNSFGKLLPVVKVKSNGQFDDGNLDELEGLFWGEDGQNIKMYIHNHREFTLFYFTMWFMCQCLPPRPMHRCIVLRKAKILAPNLEFSITTYHTVIWLHSVVDIGEKSSILKSLLINLPVFQLEYLLIHLLVSVDNQYNLFAIVLFLDITWFLIHLVSSVYYLWTYK
jgi:hypothetical protein